MDFLPKTANLQGGDTRKTPNLAYHDVGNYGANHGIGNYGANHGVRCRARVSPTRSLQSLPIPQITAFPLNPFQPKYPKAIHDTWEPLAHLTGSEHIIREFNQKWEQDYVRKMTETLQTVTDRRRIVLEKNAQRTDIEQTPGQKQNGESSASSTSELAQ